MAAHVHEQERIGRVGQAHERLDHVVHVRVIAQAATLVEQLDGTPLDDGPREGVDGEVGALARPVHGEQSCHADRQPGHCVVGMDERLAGDLGGAVR